MCVVRIFGLLCLLVAASAPASAQLMSCGATIPASERAFSHNEKLSYAVSYSAAFINMDVADVEFHTTKVQFGGKPCFKIHAVGRTRNFFNFFFKMEDKYDSWLDAETLRPLKATSNLREGGYRFRSEIDFVWKDAQAHTFGENIKSKRSSRRTFNNIGSCSYDVLSMFFNMRCAKLDGLVRGESQHLTIVFEDTVRSVRLKYLGRDVRRIDDVGRVRTRKFTCQLATSTDDSFKDGDEFLIWLTDDKNCIPIYMESPIRVGKIYVNLSSWSNLHHPFSSIIVDNKRR